MTIAIFLLALGATARITRLITRDFITRQLRVCAIRRFGPDHDIPYLLTCPWCLSIWVAGGVMTIAWFYGEHPGFIIPAAALTASYLIGIAASILDTAEELD
ncbi:DUF1360 domain-containing protein [Prescottella agglutinans]|uniref:Metal-binding membrane protein n=1 Tax=Prescottella agglutinans TaxID=1644129 RepID=A0ABT6M7W5_9NOCA|nr:DUF1360 domain-containing protein [Prescottella agglutinans]MDH6279519.1 putative metal-binding membrane protein [Prescottella agglutinans]